MASWEPLNIKGPAEEFFEGADKWLNGMGLDIKGVLIDVDPKFRGTGRTVADKTCNALLFCLVQSFRDGKEERQFFHFHQILFREERSHGICF